MKSKLLSILLITVLSGIFSACSEEEVTPLNNNRSVASDGQALDDHGF